MRSTSTTVTIRVTVRQYGLSRTLLQCRWHGSYTSAVGIVFTWDPSYHGEGISLGLARGLTAWVDGQNVTQEGMGLGTAACRHRGFTFFCGNADANYEHVGVVRARCRLDRRIMWRMGKCQSVWLTRLVESAANSYMSIPRLQLPLMAVGTLIRRKLRLNPRFAPAPPVAETQIIYAVRGQQVGIDCTVRLLRRGTTKVFIMNELGADFFPKGIVKQRMVAPPTGWQPLALDPPVPALYDPHHGLRFSLSSIMVTPAVPFTLYWGREKIADYCWAGFEIEVDVRRFQSETLSVRYVVSLA
jgi:hypothetical protein